MDGLMYRPVGHGNPDSPSCRVDPAPWSLPLGQSLHSRTGCICEGRSEESVGPLLGELARVSEDDLHLGIPDLQACQHVVRGLVDLVKATPDLTDEVAMGPSTVHGRHARRG